MKTRINRIALGIVAVTTLAVAGVLLSSQPAHPKFGAFVTATIHERRSNFKDFMDETKSKLLGVPENRDAWRYVNLGGALLEIGGASPDSAWVYLNHPKLNSHPQWEMALSTRTSLDEVTLQDLQCRFYPMGDPEGEVAFGSGWKGHAVRVAEGRIVFIRAITNHSTTYAVELTRVDRGRSVRFRVTVRYLKMTQSGAETENHPFSAVTNGSQVN